VSVYVDNSRNAFGNMKMCHMIADTPGELRDMALRIGVQLKWFQHSASIPHFDIAQSKRALAVAEGAIEIDRRAFVATMKRIRSTWPVANGKWTL
jgi:hypothetical protein